MKAGELFNEEQRRAVSQAVADAEKTTAAEIVPAVATTSGRYDRAEDLVGLLTALLLLVLVWCSAQRVEIPADDWNEAPRLAFGLAGVLLTIIAGFVGGSFAATRYPALCRPLIRAGELQAEVERRGFEIFVRSRVRRTAGGTGVLLYVSLYERMVCVLPDDAVAAKVPQDQWALVRDLIIDGIRKGTPAEGMIAAIRRTGELLAPLFPPSADNRNELANELVVLD